MPPETVAYLERVQAALGGPPADDPPAGDPPGEGAPGAGAADAPAVPARRGVPPPRRGAPVTRASLAEHHAALAAQLDQARAAGEEIDADGIAAALEAIGALIGGLDAQAVVLPATIDALANPVPPDEIEEARAARLAAIPFRAVLIQLAPVRTQLNAGPRAAREQAEQEEAFRQAAEAAEEARRMSAAKGRRGDGASSSSSGPVAYETAEDEDAAIAGIDIEGKVEFPHKGKHRPPPGAVGKINKLAEQTVGRGRVALYLVADPRAVLQLEQHARQNGLLLHDDFTIIHRFRKVVGADGGEPTPCVRIDGDHGHPIMETGPANTSFESYLKSDIAHYAGLGASNRDAAINGLRHVRAFLERVGLAPAAYLTPALLGPLHGEVMG